MKSVAVILSLSLACVGASLAAGCSSTLDTGYVPRKIGSSDETRRGFYAQPFTPEAKAAKDYQQEFGDTPSGRPKPGY